MADREDPVCGICEGHHRERDCKHRADTPVWMNTHAAALILQVSEATIRRWMDRGILEGSVTPTGYRRVDAASVKQLKRRHGL